MILQNADGSPAPDGGGCRIDGNHRLARCSVPEGTRHSAAYFGRRWGAGQSAFGTDSMVVTIQAARCDLPLGFFGGVQMEGGLCSGGTLLRRVA